MRSIAEAIFDPKFDDTTKIKLYKPDHEKTKKFIANKEKMLAKKQAQAANEKEENADESTSDSE